MPRIHISVQDADTIENLALDEFDQWNSENEPSERRVGVNGRDHGRGERRFGGAEALARKRAERRKQYHRRSTV